MDAARYTRLGRATYTKCHGNRSDPREHNHPFATRAERPAGARGVRVATRQRRTEHKNQEQDENNWPQKLKNSAKKNITSCEVCMCCSPPRPPLGSRLSLGGLWAVPAPAAPRRPGPRPPPGRRVPGSRAGRLRVQRLAARPLLPAAPRVINKRGAPRTNVLGTHQNVHDVGYSS